MVPLGEHSRLKNAPLIRDIPVCRLPKHISPWLYQSLAMSIFADVFCLYAHCSEEHTELLLT